MITMKVRDGYSAAPTAHLELVLLQAYITTGAFTRNASSGASAMEAAVVARPFERHLFATPMQSGNRVAEHTASPEPNPSSVVASRREMDMRSVKTTLLWLTGFPLPLILLVALFVHPG